MFSQGDAAAWRLPDKRLGLYLLEVDIEDGPLGPKWRRAVAVLDPAHCIALHHRLSHRLQAGTCHPPYGVP